MNDLCANRRVLVVDDNRGIHADLCKILGAVGDAGATPSESPETPAASRARLDALAAQVLGRSPAPAPGPDFSVDSAFQGREALDLVEAARAEQRPYALAFVDMHMPPGWDGMETIERLWRVDADLQVVICTAHSDHPWSTVTRRLGNSTSLLVLRKPFDSIEARQLATALAHKWDLEAETRRLRDRVAELAPPTPASARR